MVTRSATHSTFVIERRLAFAPAAVYAAWADPHAKGRWFVGPDDWKKSGHRLDFRIGGSERVSGGPPGGPVHHYHAVYQDIVPDERIVYIYDMHLDANRISVSLATVEFTPDAGGTRLRLTEQGVFLDGYDDAGAREEGTRGLLDQLEAALRAGTDH
jgi:uncharacterized protein YndB with AHSA1/START domain